MIEGATVMYREGRYKEAAEAYSSLGALYVFLDQPEDAES